MSTFKKAIRERNKQKPSEGKEAGEDALVVVNTASTPDTTQEPETPQRDGDEQFYGDDQADSRTKQKSQRAIPVDRILPNRYQKRLDFNEEKLLELAKGMKEHGFVGPGVPVRAHPTLPHTYELVWGERRWRAAKLAGLTAVPCEVSTYSDADMIELGLLENIQREDLSNMEEGRAFTSLLELKDGQGKAKYSIRYLAQRLGKDKSYIEDRLQYVRVPEDVQRLAIEQPNVSPRIIRELGELSKVLEPEERSPVIEGVREGKLRIEDVREIRRDVEEHARKPFSSEPTTSSSQPGVKQPSASSILPVAMSVATDSLLSSPPITEQGGRVQEPERSTPIPPSPLTSASAMMVSVFEKSLKRDNEALERIFQRIIATFETLTEDEQKVLRQHVKRWGKTIQELISKLEPEEQ
ncbi:MAG: ParB/RepB/Spo0J family partition protein [Ktedonobacteraceae bacterium]